MSLRPPYFTFAIFCLAIALFGCGRDNVKPGTTVERTGLAPAIYVKDSDPKMIAAIELARNTLDDFLTTLQNSKPGQLDFRVKARMKEDARAEHMWITNVRLFGDQIGGILDNEPLKLRLVKRGDEVRVQKNDVSDWMYVENGKLVGGYTIRVLREKMSAEERQAFDRKLGMTID